MKILQGRKEDVAAWMVAQIPHCTELPGGFEALGVVDSQGEFKGGCLYTNYRKGIRPGFGDIEILAAGKGRWLDRTVIRELLSYPFNQLGCHRVTAITRKRNKPARRLLEKLGFKLEGVVRQGLAPHGDAFVYGMLKSECRWI